MENVSVESMEVLIVGLKYIAVALCMFPLGRVASAIGKIYSSLIAEVSRNPAARNSLFTYALIGFALAEAAGLFAFVVGFIILFS